MDWRLATGYWCEVSEGVNGYSDTGDIRLVDEIQLVYGLLRDLRGKIFHLDENSRGGDYRVCL